jgi:hypothetical protein
VTTLHLNLARPLRKDQGSSFEITFENDQARIGEPLGEASGKHPVTRSSMATLSPYLVYSRFKISPWRYGRFWNEGEGEARWGGSVRGFIG